MNLNYREIKNLVLINIQEKYPNAEIIQITPGLLTDGNLLMGTVLYNRKESPIAEDKTYVVHTWAIREDMSEAVLVLGTYDLTLKEAEHVYLTRSNRLFPKYSHQLNQA